MKKLTYLITENIENDTLVDNASKALLRVFSKYPLPDQLYKAILFTLMQTIEYHSEVDGFEYMRKFASKVLKGENYILNKEVIDKIIDKNKEDIDMKNDTNYESSEEISLNGITVNKKTRTVHFEDDNKILRLSNKLFQLIFLLMQKHDKILNRDYIMDRIWGDESNAGLRVVDVNVSKIKSAMPLKYRKHIHSISGGGYIFDTTK